ncbi:unnamed protein product [Mytilus coruscus]|uniref:Reverse transcriptase domain-containing protein n=1 Tax=Mytilus coruscus TaxID=42192 RepID=A0A6J8AQ63_MYTCO|nr:unnamed protein product [Mytilus coruscus]
MDQRNDLLNSAEQDDVNISIPATPLNTNFMRNTDEENTTVKSLYTSNNTAITQKENIADQKEIEQAQLRQRETKIRKREEEEIQKSADIILIQEHWLYHFELELLKELHPKIVGVGKAVDSSDPIAASHMPRGYGGVAVLWQKSIDCFINPLPDGSSSRRKQKLNELMVECKLKTNSKGFTFINVNGIDTSEIDYFLYTDPKCEPSKRLIDLSSNVSDHHPISQRIKCNIAREQQSRNSGKQKHKVKWNKVDKSRYEETTNREIGDCIEMLNSDRIDIELTTLQAMDLLSNTAKQLDQQKTTAIRNEEIRRKHNERNDIINYNQNDKQKFYKLIRKQRQNGNTFINDLHVENEVFERDNIINGWNQHFSKLAVPSEHSDFNYQHLALCELDYISIKRISEHYVTKHVALDTIEKAIKSINRGKAEDIFGISIENFLFAGQQFKIFLQKLINRMFQERLLPDIIKTGLLSPVFKNKGDKNDAKYYRGITVLPILLKIIEFILRIDLRSGSLKLQSILQKGFTTNTSPLNAAIILEEVYREYMDKKIIVLYSTIGCKVSFQCSRTKNAAKKSIYIRH